MVSIHLLREVAMNTRRTKANLPQKFRAFATGYVGGFVGVLIGSSVFFL